MKKLKVNRTISCILIAFASILFIICAYYLGDLLPIGRERVVSILLFLLFIAAAVMIARRMSQHQSGNPKFKLIKSTNITFDQIAGMQQVKDEVQIYIDIMKRYEEYATYGIRIPKGIILEGSPGNGKTLLAKAIASEMNLNFIQANAADIGGILVGKGSQDLKKLFQFARAHKPCIVFLDEIDAIGRKRSDQGSDATNDGNRTVASLLTELDGFDDNEGIFVIAATNRIDSMDDALIRPGRFDRKITIKNPDFETRKELIQMYTKQKKLSEDINIDDLAWKFSQLSCADIENCINEAAILAVSEHRSYITSHDFEQTIVKQKIRGYILDGEQEIYQKELTAYHEAGHALMTHLLTDDVIEAISILPTTSHVKGFTMSYTTVDRNLLSLQEIKDRIIILMAGRAAEYLFQNKEESLVTTGCSDDMNKAVDLMKLYLKSTTNGICYNQNNERDMSEVFQTELRKLSESLWAETLALCSGHWFMIQTLSEELIEQKWISKTQILAILDGAYNDEGCLA